MSKRPDRLTFWRTPEGWRWHYRRSNGRILANGGQAYSRRIDAINSAAHVCGIRAIGEGLNRLGEPVVVEFR